MREYNIAKLSQELQNAGIAFGTIDSRGWVRSSDFSIWIHERPDVAAVLAAHDPTPDPEPPSLEDRLEMAELFLSLLLDQEVTQ